MAPAQAGASLVSTRISRMVGVFLACISRICHERQQAIVGQDTHSRRNEQVNRMRDHIRWGQDSDQGASSDLTCGGLCLDRRGKPSPACDRLATKPQTVLRHPFCGDTPQRPGDNRQTAVLSVLPDQRSVSFIDEHGDEPRHSTTQPNYAKRSGKPSAAQSDGRRAIGPLRFRRASPFDSGPILARERSSCHHCREELKATNLPRWGNGPAATEPSPVPRSNQARESSID